MQNKPKSRDISEFDYTNRYNCLEYGFYDPSAEDFYFTSCRAHNVWALMAYMRGTATFEKYCFQDKNSVTIHLGGTKTGYLEKLELEFRKLETKFKLRPTKFTLTKSKNNKDIIKVESSKFWLKSVQIYSLFLLLLRSADGDFLVGEDKEFARYYSDIAPNIPELINLTKNHTQKFGWETKKDFEMDEDDWDSAFHDYGIGNFFNPKHYENYDKTFITFKELKDYVKNKKSKKVLDNAA